MSEAARQGVRSTPVGALWHGYSDRHGAPIAAGDILRGSEGSLWRVEVAEGGIRARLICRHSDAALELWWLTIPQCARVSVV